MTDFIALPPSIDDAHRNSLWGTIKFIIEKLVKQDMDNMLPAQVVATDRASNRVTVQIMVAMVNTLGQNVARAQLISVPVYNPSCKGFIINMPLQAGDTGWIKATDTDMSLFLQTIKNNAPSISPPNTRITHKFDSSVFFPDNMNQNVTIASGDANNLVIQTPDGTTKISIGAGSIALTSSTLTHNGVNIGSTHVHSDPQGGVTGPPQ